MPEAIFLGIDFGMKRIGVAVGQTVTATANPLCILKARDGVPQWSAMDQLVRTWTPNQIVLGIPVHMDGAESNMTRCARSFKRKLINRYGIPVHEMEERLSSEAAAWHVQASGETDLDLDAHAAALMLQSFLAGLT